MMMMMMMMMVMNDDVLWAVMCGYINNTYFPQMCNKITKPIKERLKTRATVGPLAINTTMSEQSSSSHHSIM